MMLRMMMRMMMMMMMMLLMMLMIKKEMVMIKISLAVLPMQASEDQSRQRDSPESGALLECNTDG